MHACAAWPLWGGGSRVRIRISYRGVWSRSHFTGLAGLPAGSSYQEYISDFFFVCVSFQPKRMIEAVNGVLDSYRSLSLDFSFLWLGAVLFLLG